MDKKLNAGIIGAGRIGQVHTMSIINHLPRVRIKGITDVDASRAKAWAEQAGIETIYQDYKQMLADPEVEAVFICSSTDTHADIAIEAAQAGKHIFCEKPVDMDLKRVAEVIACVKKAGVKLQVGFNRRFDHNFQKIKELIDAETIGDLQVLKITSRDPSPPPIEYVKISGGIFIDMTAHDFDMARFLAGSEAEEIYVAASCLVDPKIGEAGDADTALVTIRFQNGTLCSIDNSRQAVYGYDQRVEAFGSKGKAEIANDHPSTAVWSTQDGVFSEKPLHFFLERYMGSYAEEIRQFTDAVMNGTPIPVTGEDAMQALKLGLAALKSVQEKRVVKLSELQ